MIFYFILSCLAVFRITYMIINENGPYNIFGKLSYYIKSKRYKDGGIVQLFTCFYCLSIYISIPFSILLSNSILEFILYTLSLSTVSIFLYEWFESK